jgi:hypothetical protein
MEVHAHTNGGFTAVDTINAKTSFPLLFADNKELLNKYFNELLLYQRATETRLNLSGILKEKATGLIEFYKNKYHLE